MENDDAPRFAGITRFCCERKSMTCENLPLIHKAKIISLCGIAAVLTACTSAPKVPEIVRVPVPVSCIQGEPPAKPDTLSEAEILVMDDYAATLTVWTERLLLKSYAVRAEAVILGCR